MDSPTCFPLIVAPLPYTARVSSRAPPRLRRLLHELRRHYAIDKRNAPPIGVQINGSCGSRQRFCIRHGYGRSQK
ncbi:hypothetical protein EVAR_46294_1 [Eumeta japonica]|uniref:Uncharacterized protein n=1 Tax=Eumeta variegata TaxID=151549 RepID=A0A4C1XW06_EUMVA|nr:hypothetical protein EVAR_46294_1 [Eumeta japonica]